jgi:hypothetical protein
LYSGKVQPSGGRSAKAFALRRAGAHPSDLSHPSHQIKGFRFRTPQFADVVFEFVVENGRVRALKQRDPGGEMSFPKVSGR